MLNLSAPTAPNPLKCWICWISPPPTLPLRPGWDRSLGQTLSLSLSLSLYISLSTSLSIYLSLYLSLCLSLYLSLCLSLCLSQNLSLYLSLYLPLYISLYLSLYISLYLSIYISSTAFRSRVSLALSLSLSLSVFSLSLSLAGLPPERNGPELGKFLRARPRNPFPPPKKTKKNGNPRPEARFVWTTFLAIFAYFSPVFLKFLVKKGTGCRGRCHIYIYIYICREVINWAKFGVFIRP